MNETKPEAAAANPAAEHPSCGVCGSPNVVVDAFASWSVERRDWALHSTYDESLCLECDRSVTLTWVAADGEDRAARIRRLNDALRTGAGGEGVILLTQGVIAGGAAFVAAVMQAVRAFSAFDGDNDPHGEHDFGAFETAGERLFFKLDYYDPTMTALSADPGDPAVTRRVLTIMLASEY